MGAGGDDGLGVVLPHIADRGQPHADREPAGGVRPAAAGVRVRLEVREHGGGVHVDGADAHPVAAGVRQEGLRRVEAHRLGAQQSRRERRMVVALEPRRVVHEVREADRVGLREAVVREGGDLVEDPSGGGLVDAAGGGTGEEALGEPAHALAGAAGAHRATQLVRVRAREPAHVHRHLHELLLEQRHAQGLLETGAQQRVEVGDLLLLLSPADVGVDGAALDGTGPDERDLDGQVVEAARGQPGQRADLGAGLDLEDAHRVRGAEHVEHGRVLLRDLRPVDPPARVPGDEVDHLVQRRQHPQPQQVELDEVHRRAVVLVPLDDGAVLHRGGLDRDDLADRTVREDHAAGVDAQVARCVEEARGCGQDGGRHAAVLGRGQAPPAVEPLRERVLLARPVAQCGGRVPDRRLRPVGDDVRDLRGPVPPVVPVDVLDDLLAATGLDVDVDVRVARAVRGEEAVEQQSEPHRVHRRDAQDVADGGVRGRAPPLAEDVVVPAVPGDVLHDEEVAAEAHPLDRVELAVDLLPRARGVRAGAVAVVRALRDELAQVGRLPAARRDGGRGQAGCGGTEAEGGLGADAHRLRDGVPGEAGEHLVARMDAGRGRGRQPARHRVEAAPGADGGAHLRIAVARAGRVVHRVRRDRGQAGAVREVDEVADALVVVRQPVAGELDREVVRAD